MSFIHGHTYRLFSVAYPTLALNVYGTNAASTGRNVCLYDKDEDPNDIMQKWYVTRFSENDDYGFVLRSKVDNSFVLDRSDGSVSSSYNNNAHLCKETYTTALDCRVEPINVQGNIYRICLPGRNLYLTAANGNGTNPTSSITTQSQLTGANKNVYWAAEATTVGSAAYNKQCWTVVDLDAASDGDEDETGGSEYSENYAIYPCKHMNITQTAYGTYNHYLYSDANATYRDFPTDEGCADSGTSPMYCPCDEMIVEHFRGTDDDQKVNTIWLRSTSKVKFANGDEDYLVMMVMHPNDSDFSGLVKGVTTFRRGDIMFYEGTDGATANHFHISLGKGARIGNGWVENSNGAWVLNTTNGNLPIEDVFYVDPNFTTIRNDAGLNFVTLT